MSETTASEFQRHAVDTLAADLYDFDLLSGSARRHWRVETVTLVADDGIGAFVAERARFLWRRTLAVVSGCLGFAASIGLIGQLTGVLPSGQTSGAGVFIFMLGIVGALLLGWWLTVHLTPARPIAVYADPESPEPDVLITPTKRYRLGLPTLAVRDSRGELIGYLRQESHKQVAWSVADAAGKVLFVIERRPGVPTGGLLLSLLVPALGLLLMLAWSVSQVSNTVSILTKDNGYRLGSLTLPPYRKGEIAINLEDDYKRFFPRRLSVAAAVAACLY